MEGDKFFKQVTKVTGLHMDRARLLHTLRLQSPEQQEQYLEALKLTVMIYNDAQQHGGATTDFGQQEWARLNKLIAFWAALAEQATPKRKGWFGKKSISPGARLMLLRTLSPEAEIIKSGELS